ncbi:RNA polymerase, sigma-24 subunit, ECF subfamily [Pseudopedobacter saltans DSM 12145]|uniref:RNA polymerase, sigma-24 subunit, ECF subfamily n=1 Tax=Pseudopedobacter saltans (strain ATCC 51119 / DSM 12145 / JCM 21818 / CCUG 39354 / LMG 10337 / NBRC 100064 / NCIMB 13643) TaxID=762903 RepID=F0SE13_PSESL|nr:RNA polymerase sigma-70 factor [Pseudopedobacter saltans]ADY52939.1 RNA polymerase, sigma-24 subunit, ECF subfamily [Pseudopedobacter saltans DSM 12145]
MNKSVYNLEEEELISRFVKGDKNAFDLIFKKYSSHLYHAAYNLFRDKAACEDMVQDLFVDLWEKREQTQIRSLKSYLYVSIKNRALMAIRAGKVNIDDSALMKLCSKYFADQKVIAKELSDILNSSINKLPKKCQEIFKLSREGNLSNKEIAERLNISVKTVENQMTIALSRLKNSSKEFLAVLLAIYFAS